jgi:hypothetical protein
VWVLDQDTTPRPTRSFASWALETAPSVAIAAPKLVRADDNDRIVSLGVSMTRGGRAVGLADGEHDQGQHDASEDVLGSDVRGILVRTDAWRALDGLDRRWRARTKASTSVCARVCAAAVSSSRPGFRRHRDPDRTDAPTLGDRFEPVGVRRAWPPHGATAPPTRVRAGRRPAALALLLPLAVLRSVALLLGKRPSMIGPEWGATLTVLLRPAAVARARRGIRAGAPRLMGAAGTAAGQSGRAASASRRRRDHRRHRAR